MRCESCGRPGSGRVSPWGVDRGGALALVRGARAVSIMQGRNFVVPDDIKKVALPALRHRIGLATRGHVGGAQAETTCW